MHRTGAHTSSLSVGSISRASDAACYRTPCPGSTVPRGSPPPCSKLGQPPAWQPSYGSANIAADATSIVMLHMPTAPRPLPPLRPSIKPTKIITAPTSTTPTNQGYSSRRRHHHRCYGRLPTTPIKKRRKKNQQNLTRYSPDHHQRPPPSQIQQQQHLSSHT